MKKDPFCLQCGIGTGPAAATGRPRKYCSKACKQRGFRKKQQHSNHWLKGGLGPVLTALDMANHGRHITYIKEIYSQHGLAPAKMAASLLLNGKNGRSNQF